MNVFKALVQRASLLPASPRLISPHTVTRSLIPQRHWGLRAIPLMGDSSRRQPSSYLGECFPPSFMVCTIEAASYSTLGCAYRLLLEAQLPQGLRGWILPNTLPLSETPLGELGIGKKGVWTTDAHLCRVTLRPSSLQQTRLEFTSCSLCVHV